MGEVELFLGMEITRTIDTLKITQTRQIDKMLKIFGMEHCNATETPMTKGYQVNKGDEIIQDIPFRQLIGGLMFISTTSRLDITYATSFLSQYLEKPTKNLWIQGKRILRYLKGTRTHGLTYYKNNDRCIETYSDADWAANKDDRKSVSGSITMYNGNIISWLSRKQNCVALSTAEAEYIADTVSVCGLN